MGAPHGLSHVSVQAADSTHIRFAGTPREDELTRQFKEALRSGSREKVLQIANDPEFKVSLRYDRYNPLHQAVRAQDEALFDLVLTKLEDSTDINNALTLMSSALDYKQWGMAQKLIEKDTAFREVICSTILGLKFPDTPEWANYLVSQGLNLRGNLNSEFPQLRYDTKRYQVDPMVYEVGVWAAKIGKLQLLEKALEAGFDPNTTIKSTRRKYPDSRVLDMAVDKPAVLKRLLEKGARLRHPQHDQFPLGDVSILYVIGRLAKPEAFDAIMPALQASNEFTPAEKKKIIDNAFYAALYSADVRILSGTTKDKVDTVKRFLEAGCGRDASGKIDPKLMEYTVASGLLLDTLVEAGIDVNARIGKKKQTALMFVASQLNPRDTLDRLEKLIGLGAKVNERDKWGWTALMHAMDTSLISSRWEKHKIEMIPKVADFLKSKGATLTWKDKVKLKVERARPTRVFARTMAHIFGGLPAFPARLSIYE